MRRIHQIDPLNVQRATDAVDERQRVVATATLSCLDRVHVPNGLHAASDNNGELFVKKNHIKRADEN